MSIYAIKDEEGDLWGRAYDKPETTKNFRTWTDPSDAEFTRSVNYPDGRVVELVEKAELVEVSEKSDDELIQLKREIRVGTTNQSAWSWFAHLKAEGLTVAEIFHALDVGWTVKQPKRWYVRAPKEWGGDGRDRLLFWKDHNNGLHTQSESNHHPSPDEQFTADEIDKYHLSGFETVEVED